MTDIEAVEAPQRKTPSRRHNRRPAWPVVAFLCGASAVLGAFGPQLLLKNAGPKNGITFVDTGDCDVIGGFGPRNRGGIKETERDILVVGVVSITLKTSQLPESLLRNPGLIPTPVFVNRLTVECPPPPPDSFSPARPPHYVSAPETLFPLGGLALAS